MVAFLGVKKHLYNFAFNFKVMLQEEEYIWEISYQIKKYFGLM